MSNIVILLVVLLLFAALTILFLILKVTSILWIIAAALIVVSLAGVIYVFYVRAQDHSKKEADLLKIEGIKMNGSLDSLIILHEDLESSKQSKLS